MRIKNLSIVGLAMVAIFASSVANSSTIDLLNFRCVRQDREPDRMYLSEIHFLKEVAGDSGKGSSKNVRTISEAIPGVAGEILSYVVTGTTKQFISGYSLFSISYEDQVISGKTGDPNTRVDGGFTLSPIGQRASEMWHFVYNSVDNQTITSDFKCSYPLPPDSPSL